jgi:hypothetical protein
MTVQYAAAASSGHTVSSCPLTAQVVALRPIEEGEELVHSYIDQQLSFEARREALLDYGFACSCPKCDAPSPRSDTRACSGVEKREE